MTEFDIENFIEGLKEAGYFRSEDIARGHVFRYNGLYDSFQELDNRKLIALLSRIIGNDKAYRYWSTVKCSLDIFPSKQYHQYQSYIGFSKMRSLDSVEREFLNGFYKDNQMKKRKTEIKSNIDSSNDLQILINNDIFTNGKDLYKYDSDKKTFILVTEDNIGTFINCNDKTITNRILENGLNTKYVLTNVVYTIDLFTEGHEVTNGLKDNKDGYDYIMGLKENITVKYEDTFGLIFC